ncbi:hypothetical protein HHI36_003982 [Cryptolaemus montrouzieri]|uniref:Uncharacterized protein n=1 Tax=Cryptolaemus montrouzieri TaxID=559131 RepID=A0ABD2NPU9_9CUCU
MTIEFPSYEIKLKSRTVRDLKFSELQFQFDLMNKNIWPDNDKTVDETAKHLVYIIEKTLSIQAPIRQRDPVCKWGNKLCWTSNIKSEISRRDILFETAVFTKRDQSWLLYRQQRKQIRQQKQMYYEQKIDMARGDSKEMWQALKGIMGSGKQNERKKEGLHKNIRKI